VENACEVFYGTAPVTMTLCETSLQLDGTVSQRIPHKLRQTQLCSYKYYQEQGPCIGTVVYYTRHNMNELTQLIQMGPRECEGFKSENQIFLSCKITL
jgi:hypothetical protein